MMPVSVPPADSEAGGVQVMAMAFAIPVAELLKVL
jgi:hypothetical protein